MDAKQNLSNIGHFQQNNRVALMGVAALQPSYGTFPKKSDRQRTECESGCYEETEAIFVFGVTRKSDGYRHTTPPPLLRQDAFQM